MKCIYVKKQQEKKLAHGEHGCRYKRCRLLYLKSSSSSSTKFDLLLFQELFSFLITSVSFHHDPVRVYSFRKACEYFASLPLPNPPVTNRTSCPPIERPRHYSSSCAMQYLKTFYACSLLPTLRIKIQVYRQHVLIIKGLVGACRFSRHIMSASQVPTSDSQGLNDRCRP